MYIYVITLLSLCVSQCISDHIMIFTPLTTKSETILFYPLAEALADKGHKLTVLSAYPTTKPMPKVKLVSPKALVNFILNEQSTGGDLLKMRIESGFYDEYNMMMFYDDSYIVTTTEMMMLQDKEILEMVESKERVDLMIINGAFNIQGLVLVSIFNCPFIYVDGSGFYPWHADVTGNYYSSGTVPTGLSPYTTPMALWQRICNTYRTYQWHYFYNSVAKTVENMLQDSVYGKYMMKPIAEVEKNVSLVFSFRDPSLEFPRPFYANVIKFGCVHCVPAKPLRKDLADFVSGSKEHGFIYFSLGSFAQLNGNKEYFRDVFFKAFENLPQRFLVKWDEEVTNEEIGAPPNVKISKWMPQQDIIGHPNCRAFISHSGLFGTMESIYHAVPVVSIPMFWDQDYNSNLVQKFGMGIKLEAKEITADSLTETLKKITTDLSYRENAVRRSKILRDQPMKPLDSMVYWTEYVLRHKGADHLRPVDAMNMYWYQIWFLDVVAIFIGVILLLLFVIKKICCYVLCSGDSRDVKKKIKSN